MLYSLWLAEMLARGRSGELTDQAMRVLRNIGHQNSQTGTPTSVLDVWASLFREVAHNAWTDRIGMAGKQVPRYSRNAQLCCVRPADYALRHRAESRPSMEVLARVHAGSTCDKPQEAQGADGFLCCLWDRVLQQPGRCSSEQTLLLSRVCACRPDQADHAQDVRLLRSGDAPSAKRCQDQALLFTGLYTRGENHSLSGANAQWPAGQVDGRWVRQDLGADSSKRQPRLGVGTPLAYGAAARSNPAIARGSRPHQPEQIRQQDREPSSAHTECSSVQDSRRPSICKADYGAASRRVRAEIRPARLIGACP